MSSDANEAPPSGDQPSWQGALAAIAASVAISLLVAEVATRLFYEPAPTHIRELSLSFSEFYHSDPELGWMPRAGLSASYVRFDARFKTNSQGLRDREYTERKPAGTTRIVVVGDSHTWGFGVDDEEVYTERLESLLPKTEVLNLGVTAYGLWQEVDYFKRKGLRYSPDILIVGLTQNDIGQGPDRERIDQANAGLERAKQPGGGKGLFARLSPKRSAFFRFVGDRVDTNKTLVRIFTQLGLRDELVGVQGIDNNLYTSLREYPPWLEDAFGAVEAKLAELERLTDEHGIRLIVVTIPALQAVEATAFQQSIAGSVFEPEDFDLEKPYRRIAAAAKATGIEFVDPLERFRAAKAQGTVLYLKRDVHLSPAGHELLGAVLADYLTTEGPSRPL